MRIFIPKKEQWLLTGVLVASFLCFLFLLPNQTKTSASTTMYVKPDNGLVYYLKPSNTEPDGRIPFNTAVTVHFTQLINDTQWSLATYKKQDIWIKPIYLMKSKKKVDPYKQVIREVIISSRGKKHTITFTKTPKFTYVKQYTRPYPSAEKTSLKLHNGSAFRVMKIRETKGGIWVYGEAKGERGWVLGKYIKNIQKSLPQ